MLSGNARNEQQRKETLVSLYTRHWRHMMMSYFRIKSCRLEQERHCLALAPYFLGQEYQMFSKPSLKLAENLRKNLSWVEASWHYRLCCFFQCLWRCCLVLNVLSHMWHLNFRSPLWTLATWWFRFDLFNGFILYLPCTYLTCRRRPSCSDSPSVYKYDKK